MAAEKSPIESLNKGITWDNLIRMIMMFKNPEIRHNLLQEYIIMAHKQQRADAFLQCIFHTANGRQIHVICRLSSAHHSC